MNPRHGEVYDLAFGFAGKRRPVVVVSRDSLNAGRTVIVVPFTSQRLEERRSLSNCVFFQAGEHGLTKDCVAKAEEITLVAKDELDTSTGPRGRIPHARMEEIVRAIRYVLNDQSV